MPIALRVDFDAADLRAGARAAGFTGAVDTWAMFAEQIAGYRAAEVLPPA